MELDIFFSNSASEMVLPDCFMVRKKLSAMDMVGALPVALLISASSWVFTVFISISPS